MQVLYTKSDLSFGEEYNEALHGKTLRKEINLSHLSTIQQNIVFENMKQFWRVFSKKCTTVPVKNYECEIDTGSSCPIDFQKYNF